MSAPDHAIRFRLYHKCKAINPRPGRESSITSAAVYFDLRFFPPSLMFREATNDEEKSLSTNQTSPRARRIRPRKPHHSTDSSHHSDAAVPAFDKPARAMCHECCPLADFQERSDRMRLSSRHMTSISHMSQCPAQSHHRRIGNPLRPPAFTPPHFSLLSSPLPKGSPIEPGPSTANTTNVTTAIAASPTERWRHHQSAEKCESGSGGKGRDASEK